MYKDAVMKELLWAAEFQKKIKYPSALLGGCWLSWGCNSLATDLDIYIQYKGVPELEEFITKYGPPANTNPTPFVFPPTPQMKQMTSGNSLTGSIQFRQLIPMFASSPPWTPYTVFPSGKDLLGDFFDLQVDVKNLEDTYKARKDWYVVSPTFNQLNTFEAAGVEALSKRGFKVTTDTGVSITTREEYYEATNEPIKKVQIILVPDEPSSIHKSFDYAHCQIGVSLVDKKVEIIRTGVIDETYDLLTTPPDDIEKRRSYLIPNISLGSNVRPPEMVLQKLHNKYSRTTEINQSLRTYRDELVKV